MVGRLLLYGPILPQATSGCGIVRFYAVPWRLCGSAVAPCNIRALPPVCLIYASWTGCSGLMIASVTIAQARQTSNYGGRCDVRAVALNDTATLTNTINYSYAAMRGG